MPADGAADPAEVRDARRRAAARVHGAGVAWSPLDGPLPLTPNGKLDRAALPAPDWSALAGDARPATPASRSCSPSCSPRCSGLPAVGVDDNFFALGGHSMAAMRLCGRVRAVFGVDLAIRDVFDAPDRRRARRPARRCRASPPLTRRAHTGPVTAPVQHNHGGDLDSGVDQAFAIRWDSPGALAEALADVVARHEPLGDPALFRTEWDGETLRVAMSYRAADEWSVVPLLRDLAHRLRAPAAPGTLPSGRSCPSATPTTRPGRTSCSR